MAQPKKLTHAQRQEKKMMTQLAPYYEDLAKIKRAMRNVPSGMDTWRWAALDVFRSLSAMSCKHDEKDRLQEIALSLAREAQIAINYK